MKLVLNIIGTVLLGLVVVAGASLIAGAIVSFAWNRLMPYLFGLPTLDYWQGFLMSMLIGTLFSKTKISSKE